MSQQVPYWFTRVVRLALAIIVIKILLVALGKWLKPDAPRSSV